MWSLVYNFIDFILPQKEYMYFDKVLEFTEKHKKIVQHYKKVYIFVFKYFLFSLVFLLATIFTIKLTSKNDIATYEEPEMLSIRRIELK